MESNEWNRMASPRKRGRPSLAEVAARAAPVDAIPVVITAVHLPPMRGFRCPHCGRGQAPKITQTAGVIRYCKCSLCDGRMRVEYSTDGLARVIYPM